jgi:S-layer homology domain.
MKGVLRKTGMAVMSVLLALIVFRLLPAQTGYAATKPTPLSLDYFVDDSGNYPAGDDSLGPHYNFIGSHYEYGVAKTVLQFDLSSMSATDTVSSAILKVHVTYTINDILPAVTPLILNVYGAKDNINENSTVIPERDSSPIASKSGIENLENQDISLDIASYINSQVQAGETKATLVLEGNPAGTNQFAIASKETGANAPTLAVTTVPNAKVTSVSVPADHTYTAGQNLDFTVNFDQNVNVSESLGTPFLPLTIGTTPVQASYKAGSGTSALTFRYTVLSGDLDTDGITLGNAITLNGGTIKNASNEASILTLNNIGSLANVKVDAVIPTVASVVVPTNDTYGSGKSLQFTVKFSKPVNVAAGTPTLGLTIGATNVQAAYSSGSGSDSLVFLYALQDGQNDTNGIAVGTLSLNGATIKDGAGNTAVLTLNNVGSTTGVLVDTAAPTIDTVDVPEAGTYKLGDQLSFTVHYNENVTVTGTPVLPVTLGSSSVQASYASGSGTKNLLFKYTVQAGDLDTNGIQPGSSLILNGGTIQDSAKNNGSLTLAGIGNNMVLVDAVAPAVVSVIVPISKTYIAGDTLDFTVQFNENVTVTGTPYLPVTIGSTTVQAQYASGSGTNTLLFSYTVQAGDLDTDGIVVAGLNLNGGTIKDTATNDANLTLNSVGSTASVLIDAAAPSVSSVTVPTSQTYGLAAALEFTVHFSEKVVISGGTPSIPVIIGASTVQAQYLSGSGTDSIVFQYVVKPGDNDQDGIAVGGAIALNGSTLEDEAGNAAGLTLSGVESTTAVLVDTAAAEVTNVEVPAGSSYNTGAVLDFTVHYNENVAVTGTPTLPLIIGSSTVQATYVSGSGTNALLFRYTVLSGQEDSDGIEIGSTLVPNGGTLKDAAGNEADLSLTSIGDASEVLVDAVAPSVESIDVPLSGIYKAGDVLNFTIYYDEKVAVTGSPYITVTIGTATVRAVYASGSGTNDITFSYSIQAGDADSDGIALGTMVLNGGVMTDSAGNAASVSLTGAGSTNAVLVDTTAPSVTGVEVPDDGIYKEGGILEFTVQYNEKVAVTGGTPFLPVTIGAATVHAVYESGSGTSSLLFRYEVQPGDNDLDGIQAGSSLDLNGAVIQDAAGNAAVLTLTPGGTSGVLVDTAAPAVSNVLMPGAAYYHEGSTLSFTVHYSEKVTVTGTPSLPLTIGSSTVQAEYVSGSDTDSLVFSYTILSGQLDLDGIASGSMLDLNGGTIKDAAGNEANLTLVSIGDTSGVIVDAIAPVIESVDLPANATYVAGEHLEFTIHYDEAVEVTGAPYISITVGSSVVQAQYESGSGTKDLLFRYTVQTGDNDSDGIEAGTLNLNGGTLKDATGNNAEAVLSGLDSTAGVKVDAVAPAATSLDVPADGTYKAGEALMFTVHYDEAAIVTGGTPYLTVTIGSAPVQALYVSGTGTNELVFRYTVAADQEDADGIEVGSSVNLNGASIKDAAGNAAGSALTGAGHISMVRVDAVAPTVSNVSVPANGTYKEGDQLNFTVNFNENVEVAGGTPYLTVTIGSTEVQALYVSGTGTTALEFRYTVQAGDLDIDGIAAGSTIVLNGSSLQDAAGNAADLTLVSVGNTSGVIVDAIAPVISSVDLPANATYVAGEHLEFTLHYDETVEVTGAPYILITVGSSVVQAQYESGSGTKDLLFRYTVQTGDNDSDGIEAGALNLNGGTLKDATGNNAEAVLSGLGSTAGVKVDAVAPSITQVYVPASGSYKAGATLQFTVHFSENVNVTGGNPQLDVKLEGETVQAKYVSGSGTNALLFQYEVQAGDTDSDGIELAAGLSLNGAAIADQAGNAALLTLAGAADTASVKVDTTAPAVSLVSVPADGTYHAGANLDFIVKVSEPIILNDTAGTPHIEIQIGSSVVNADYMEAVSSSELKFRYTVRLEDQDSDGISIEPGALILNGAIMTDAAGNSLGTTLNGIGSTQNVKISNNFSITLSEANWTNQDVTVTVATDPDNRIEYKLGSSGTWMSYTAPVVVSGEGLTVFYARVIDPENDTSEVKSVEVKIDKTAPVIVLNGNDTVMVYKGYTYTEQGAQVQDVNAAAPLATVTGTVDTAALGTYPLHYNAVDLAGNQAVEVIRTVNVVNMPVSSNNNNVRQVRVEVGDPNHPQIVVQIDIVREIIGGKKVDTVLMNEDKIKQAVENAIGAHQETVRIIVDDIPGDPADQVKVKLSVNAIKYLLDSSIQVEIQTENAKLHLSTEALGAMKGSQEFFFDIVPIRKKDEQEAVKARTVNAEAIRQIVKSGNVSMIGMPMTIETNLPKVAVQVTFPLDSNVIPSDLAQRKLFLASLGVYIEHSDGDKVFQHGKIVYSDKGYPIGLQIEVNKFSTFTIVSVEGASVHHDAYMTGYSDGTFRPNQSVTRAEMSTMLYRLLSGTLTGKGSVTAFRDVSSNYWAAEAIRFGQQVGLLNGYPDHSFKPNATITRAEMAAIIAKWLQLDPTAANPAFRDAKEHWASAQISAVAKLGYMTGYSDGTFRPDQPLTRAEAVVIINRILGRGPLTGVATPTWKDVPSSFWAFGAIEESSRSHDAARDSDGKEQYIPE